jgi:hypothetical protein
MLRRAR